MKNVKFVRNEKCKKCVNLTSNFIHFVKSEALLSFTQSVAKDN